MGATQGEVLIPTTEGGGGAHKPGRVGGFSKRKEERGWGATGWGCACGGVCGGRGGELG